MCVYVCVCVCASVRMCVCVSVCLSVCVLIHFAPPPHPRCPPPPPALKSLFLSRQRSSHKTTICKFGFHGLATLQFMPPNRNTFPGPAVMQSTLSQYARTLSLCVNRKVQKLCSRFCSAWLASNVHVTPALTHRPPLAIYQRWY